MPSRKRILDESQQRAEQADDSLVIPSEMPPGYDLPDYPPSAPPDPAVISDNTTEIVNTACDIEEKIYAQIEGARQEIDAVAIQITNAIIGQLKSRQQEIDATCLKVVKKIAKQLKAKEDEIYADAYALGYTPSVPTDAIYEIASDLSGTSIPVPVAPQVPPISFDAGPAPGPLPGEGGANGVGGIPPAGSGGFGGPGAPTGLGGGPPGGGFAPACLVRESLPWGNQPPASYISGEYVDPWVHATGGPVCFPYEVTQVFVCLPNQPGVYDIVGIAHPPGGHLWVTPGGQVAWSLTPGGFPPAGPPGGTTLLPPDPACQPEQPPGNPQPPDEPQPPGPATCINPSQVVYGPSWELRPFFVLPNGCRLSRPVTVQYAQHAGKDWCACWPFMCGGAGVPQTVLAMLPGEIAVIGPDGTVWVTTQECASHFTPVPCRGSQCYPGIMTPGGPGGPDGPGGPNGPQPPGVENCPPPPPAACGPDGQPWPFFPKPDDGGCDKFEDTINAMVEAGLNAAGFVGFAAVPGAQQSSLMNDIAKLMIGRPNAIIPDIVNRLARWLDKTVTDASKVTGCEPAKLTPVVVSRAAIMFAQQWTGAMPAQVVAAFDQAANFLCQYLYPNPAEADVAYLSDRITEDTWKCWIKQAGKYVGPSEAVREAKRTRPEAMQLCVLYRRKVLTEQAWKDAMRAVGVTREEERQHIYALSEYIPGPSDVVRFASRDVDDKDIVDKYKLDHDFDKKYADRLQPLGEAQGISKEIMRLYWRAHWRRSSPTQHFEFMQRLRPGRVPKEIETTVEDVRQSLLQDDYTIWDVDRLIAISYRPLTRTDAIQGYLIRVYSDEEFIDMLRDIGYTETDANKLRDYYSRRRQINEAKRSGLPTARTMINQYARGVLGEDSLRSQLMMTGYKDEQLEVALNSARIARGVYVADQTAKWVKQRFLHGMLDIADATVELLKGGLTSSDASALIDMWTQVRLVRGKLPSATQLCKWRGQHIITAGDQYDALMRVGWGYDDAARIVGSCTADILEAERKAAEKLAKEQAKLAEKNAKKSSGSSTPPATPLRLPNPGPGPVPAG